MNDTHITLIFIAHLSSQTPTALARNNQFLLNTLLLRLVHMREDNDHYHMTVYIY